MGVKDLMPLIRDSPKSTNTSLKQLINEHPSKTWIGIDMSILIIRSLKSSPRQCAQLFCEPKIPIDDLYNNICKELQVYIEHGFTTVCVFDGMTPKLKKDLAHMTRYGDNDTKREELASLLSATQFTSSAEENRNVARVKQLWKDLASFNRVDLVYDLVSMIKKRFGKKAICIGAPYEADHQLAALSHQGIIDYAYSIDSDIPLLGCDLVTNTKLDGKCFMIDYSTLINYKLPDKFGNLTSPSIPWNVSALVNVVCFLGNDYIRRNPGNSLSQVKDFLDSIRGLDGSVMPI